MRRDSQKRGASSRPTARCSSISTAARRITARCSLTRSSGASRFSTRSSGPTTTGAGPESAGRPSMTRSSGTSSTPPSTSSATTTSTVCPTWRRALSAPRRRRAARRRPGRRLAARRLRGADKARRHVGHTVDVVVAEDVEGGVDDVPEDRVMLGRPALSGPAPVVVGPDDLVEKRLAPEDLVKEHLAVMRLAAVDMEEQRAVGREDAPRFCESRRILTPDGSLFFHIDSREAHYCKVLLDDVFARPSFLNEIIWAYDYGGRPRKRWPAKHDTIFWYVVDPALYVFRYDDIDRVPYMAPGLVGPAKAARGKTPTDVWWNTIVSPTGKEKTGYPTQKPLKIVERIVRVHSDPGDLVVDFFAGSGTTGEAAARNGRGYLLVDSNPDAIAVMARRLSWDDPELVGCKGILP